MKKGMLWLYVFGLLTVFPVSDNSYAVMEQSRQDSSEEFPRIIHGKSRENGHFKEDELLVRFKAGFRSHSADNLHKKHGSEKIKEFPALYMHHLKLKKGMRIEDAIERYRADPSVEYAEPNYLVSVQTMPNDPRLGELWGLHNTGQTGGFSDADIDTPEAWDLAAGSSSVVVAVIDTGVDYYHEDLAANTWLNPGEDTGKQHR